MNKANDEEYLLLSGIQHFAFCPRQWALIHVEGVWAENYLTAQGRQLHDKADDPWFNELRKDKVISRAMPIRSEKLKLQGVADIVEFIRSDAGVTVNGREGRWHICPVEYKRGKPKHENCDNIQLCAQAMCLEEMLGACISRGEIYYGQIRRRTEVMLNDKLRDEVVELSTAMRESFLNAVIPSAKKGKHCKACSLADYCCPELMILQHKVDSYIESALKE